MSRTVLFICSEILSYFEMYRFAVVCVVPISSNRILDDNLSFGLRASTYFTLKIVPHFAETINCLRFHLILSLVFNKAASPHLTYTAINVT